MGVLYLAKKYMVPSLAEKCTQYLQDHLDPSNVFSILSSAQKYEEIKLVDRCCKVIDEETEEALKSDGFWTIERSLLEQEDLLDLITALLKFNCLLSTTVGTECTFQSSH